MSYSLVQGDLAPDMPISLVDDGDAYSLEVGDSIVLLTERPDGVIVELELEVVSASAGQLKRVWEAGDTDLVGVYRGQVVVTRNATPRTFPSDGSFMVWNVYRQLTPT